MRSLRSRLPPMKSLVAFEAVARHLSLTRAGQELFISREAVSRQIRILEDYLGLKLFDRLHRAVCLTAAGKEFNKVVQSNLEDIAQVSCRLQKNTQSLKITITATVAISSFWLAPRLVKYRMEHPKAEIRVVVSDAPANMVSDELDIGFRYGDGKWPGLNATKLFDIESFPVCSPGYLKDSLLIKSPFDLLSHNLVNLDGELHSHEDWSWWLKGHGVPVPDTFNTMGFDNYTNVIQVALDGQGIALGFSGLVADLLASKKLVQPLASSLTKSRSVYLVVPKGITLSAQTQNFIDWTLKEVAVVNAYANPSRAPILV